MDKVIIDGVDVSGCKYYDDGTCFHKDVMSLSCENTDCIYKQLQRAKAELKKYEDMAKKGLEEFKDVGGCWGCGLQLQLNQNMENIKKLKAENERLKQEWRLDCLKCEYKNTKADVEKYRQALQEIRDITERTDGNHPASVINMVSVIRHTINTVIGAE